MGIINIFKRGFKQLNSGIDTWVVEWTRNGVISLEIQNNVSKLLLMNKKQWILQIASEEHINSLETLMEQVYL